MQHLIAEGNDMIAECKDEDTREAVMIAAAQKTRSSRISPRAPSTLPRRRMAEGLWLIANGDG
jgi:hypothetical protein